MELSNHEHGGDVVRPPNKTTGLRLGQVKPKTERDNKVSLIIRKIPTDHSTIILNKGPKLLRSGSSNLGPKAALIQTIGITLGV